MKDLGLSKKRFLFPTSSLLKDPSKSIKFLKPDLFLETKSRVNEIVRRVDDKTLESLDAGSASRSAREIRVNFRRGKLNLVIFDLISEKIPSKDKLSTLAHHLYASSEETIFLPTVRTTLFKENGKISDRKVMLYLEMMESIISEIKSVGNAKAFIGTIPLLAPKYSRPIVNFYLGQEITSFSIDANTSDMLLHETELRTILSTINGTIPLNQAFIHACNLGFPQFEQEETRADDFLSIFAYIDVLGGTFKIRGRPIGKPRPKEFLRQHYSYRISPPYTSRINDLKNINQTEQLKEIETVHKLIGEEKMETYIQKKSKVDNAVINRLKNIVGNVRVG